MQVPDSLSADECLSWLLALASRRMFRSQEAQRRARQQAMEQLHASFEQNQTLVASLQGALANVQVLGGLLPICSICGRSATIRATGSGSRPT